MELTLRIAEPRDGAECGSMDRDSLIHERYFSREGSFYQAVEKAIRDRQLYVAETEGHLAGLMKILPKGFCGLFPYLSLVATAEQYRGQGVGSFLLDEFEEMSRKSGARKAALLVSDFNFRAKELYLRRGYLEIGLISGASKPEIGEYLMIKDL